MPRVSEYEKIMSNLKHETGSIVEVANTAGARPTIFILDSGVGGISVYAEVRRLLPNAHYLYVFDNQGFPYGEKSEEFVVQRVAAITQAVSHQYSIALMIVACNTASTVSLPTLRVLFDFPVVGTVPAIKPAARMTRNGVVGLLATNGTINRSYTRQLISQFANECQIEMLGSAQLVELAERKLQGEALPLGKIARTVEPWLSMREVPDTVVLGCTHFPLLLDELKQVFPDGTRFVDSGAAIARRSAWLINQRLIIDAGRQKNMAFCTVSDKKSTALVPVLKDFGFEILEDISKIVQIA